MKKCKKCGAFNNDSKLICEYPTGRASCCCGELEVVVEKSINECRVCGGEGKPSKGLINIHNIQTDDLSKEFETKLQDCIKCENCGHSWIPTTFNDTSIGKKTDREIALQWWKRKSMRDQSSLLNKSDIVAKNSKLSLSSLTGREIEEIWRKETKGATYGTFIDGLIPKKPNQKQFKEFDPRLFKQYIDKFSDEDKQLAFQLMFDSISDENKYNFLVKSEIIDWYKRNVY